MSLDPYETASLTMLGTGTSGGVPIIACGCDACTSGDPRDRRTRTGACVRWTDDGGRPRCVLIDCTPDLRMQALRHGLTRCDGILITHNHVDHIFGLDEVRRFNAVMNSPIDVWAEARTWEALHRVYQHIFDKGSNVNDSFVASLVPRVIGDPDGANTRDPRTGSRPKAGKKGASPGGAAAPIDIHDMRFTPVRVLHGKLPIVGYRIEAVPGTGLAERLAGKGGFPAAWLTDTSAIPTGSWRHLTGLATLCLDGLRPRHHPTHFNLDKACAAAGEMGAGRTWLIHLAHEVLHGRNEVGLPEGVWLGFDGLTVHGDGRLGWSPELVGGTGWEGREPVQIGEDAWPWVLAGGAESG